MTEADGLGIGKANVAEGEADGALDVPGDGDDVDVGEGVGVGVGVGGGGIIFSQWCNGTVAPPISFTNVSHFACSFSKSGGPKGGSAVPGKIR